MKIRNVWNYLLCLQRMSEPTSQIVKIIFSIQ
jgi:hypothetical protein